MIVSVALCTYNGEKYLAAQLDSILSQSRRVNEIVICDDVSADSTWNIVKEYQERFPLIIKSRQNHHNLGPIKNFEQAIKLTIGDVIFLSDQDDVWHSNKVEKILTFFKENKKALLVFTDGNLVNNQTVPLAGKLWEKWHFDARTQQRWNANQAAFLDLLNNRNKVTGATLTFRKALKHYIFPFELPFGYWHDTWLSLVAAGLNGLRFINEPLIDYRIHATQLIGIGNGTSMNKHAVATDKKGIDDFRDNVFEKFPRMKYLIRPPKKTIFGRIFNKLYRELKHMLPA